MANPKITKRIFYGKVEETGKTVVLNIFSNDACTAEFYDEIDTLKVGQELNDKIKDDSQSTRVNNLHNSLQAYYETICTPSTFKIAIDKIKQATNEQNIANLFKRWCSELILNPAQILEIAKENASPEQISEITAQQERIKNQLLNERNNINLDNAVETAIDVQYNLQDYADKAKSVCLDDISTRSNENSI